MRSRLANLFLDSHEDEAQAEPVKHKQRYTLLLVDDEQDVIESLKRVFREEHYRVISANSGEGGLKLLETEPVQVILADHRMPGMSGAEFLGTVKELHPSTIRIMLTGYADTSAVMGAINTGAVYKFITKPWNDFDLRVTVSLAFEQYELLVENRELKEEAGKREKQIKKLKRYVELNRSTLLKLLEQNGILPRDQSEKVIKAYQQTKKPYPRILEELGYMSFEKLSTFLKARMDIETVASKEYEPPKALMELFPEQFCKSRYVMPIKRLGEKRVMVAMADPTDYAMVEDIRFFTGVEVTAVMSHWRELIEVINRFFGEGPPREGEEMDTERLMSRLAEYDPYESIEIVLEEEEEESVEDILKDSATPPAIRLVNLVIWEALKARASDIHIEKRVKWSLVRFRVDGLLEDRIQVPENMHEAMVSRIKIMAELDIAERRRPQDGRITAKARDKTVDIRISTLPTISGEKVVMRMLDRNSSLIELSELGADPAEVEQLSALVHKPQGMILSTGPTGAGKTTTLYALLHEHSDPRVNYVTIEDPVEYYLEMAGQVLVKNKIGLDFSSILRAILRQDPNVILLGEIRDFSTAEVAFHAALTGHLVLSTLHTTSTVATVARLIDLGVNPFIIASGIEGIVAQRLVRRLCPHCKEEEEPDPEIMNLLGNPEVSHSFASRGCPECNHSGFTGRVGIFEVLVPSQEMRDLIAENFSESELNRLARASGMKTLLESGIEKVNNGLTSLSEVFRVLGPQELINFYCPGCQTQLQDWMAFCPSCGTRAKMICPGCKTPIEYGWDFCVRCGHQIKENKSENQTPRENETIMHASTSREKSAFYSPEEERLKQPSALPENPKAPARAVEEESIELEEWEKQ